MKNARYVLRDLNLSLSKPQEIDVVSKGLEPPSRVQTLTNDNNIWAKIILQNLTNKFEPFKILEYGSLTRQSNLSLPFFYVNNKLKRITYMIRIHHLVTFNINKTHNTKTYTYLF